jgi:peroxiredoxin
VNRYLLWIAVLLSVVFVVPTAFADSRDWSLVDTDGNTFSTATQLGDTPSLLIFWATWCAPCKKELSDLKSYFDGLVEKGYHVILIAEDNAKTQSKVKPYVESKKFTWPVLLDPSGEILKRYGGTSLPYTIVIDSKGKTVQKFRGAIQNTDALTRQLESLRGGEGE